MISAKLILYLAIGTLAMLVPIVIQSIWSKVKLWKSVVFAIVLTIVGTVGAYLMYFLENGWLGGTSFFGSVFFIPIAFWGISKLFFMSFGEAMDLCAPAVCIMLAIMKIQCMLSGCCGGRKVFVNSDGVVVYFPSQIVELGVALIIFTALFVLVYRKLCKGCIYPIFMLIYGVLRFILNWFRASSVDSVFPIGNLWSLVAIAIGATWFAVIYYKKKKSSQLSDQK